MAEDSFQVPLSMSGHSLREYTWLYDFHYCLGQDALAKTMATINQNGFELIAVTQYQYSYTVFFRRRTCG